MSGGRRLAADAGSEAAAVARFAGSGASYYARAFARLDTATGFVPSFNAAAALLGPVWWSARHLWAPFWAFLVLEIVAVVQISRGLFAELGYQEYERALRLAAAARARAEEAAAAIAGGAANAEALGGSAVALDAAAKGAFERAAEIAARGPALLAAGAAALIVLKLVQGFLANRALNARYRKWRADPAIPAGVRPFEAAALALFAVAAYGLTAYRFTDSAVPAWLTSFPADLALRRQAEGIINQSFQWLTDSWSDFFQGVAHAVELLLDAMETILVGAPWPVVMAVIVLLALKASGPRLAIFTAAALAYLGILGFWERSMATVALLGSAALICVVIGIPLGIVCGRNRAFGSAVRPVLDLMQTMPSFVYLIPVIAFFGVGKPPGVLATIVFGMAPVVRLTILGLQGVPPSIREAAEAFGVSKTYMLLKVDLPLAMPSIMTGINQTLLMCLSMVVVASLIGAKGLGEEVLDALTYANEGQGILAGGAILLCAIVLDRIVQSAKTKKEPKV